MNNLALTYSDLGRHADALDMHQRVLDFRLRELPKDHFDIGDISESLCLASTGISRQHFDCRCLHE
jgi:hypothetical protein